jgi:hypothetical protein
MFDERYQYPVELELELKIETWAEASPTAALSGSRSKAPGSAGGYLLQGDFCTPLARCKLDQKDDAKGDPRDRSLPFVKR